MSAQTLLLVEDEEDLLALLSFNLSRGGFAVLEAADGETALKLARQHLPDLILLDLMLPGLDGLDVCRELKSDPATAQIPIVMVTAKGEEADVVMGLEAGADDYVAKPYSQQVLASRIRAVLRRVGAAKENQEVVRAGPLEIHLGRRLVEVEGRPVELTFSEFGILLALARRPGWVMTRGQIVDAVRGENHPVTDRSVDALMVGLRKKLGDHGAIIQSVRGVGYRMQLKG